MGFDKQLRAINWVLDPVVFDDEVFAQVKDYALGAAEVTGSRHLEEIPASFSLDALLGWYGLTTTSDADQLRLVESDNGFDRWDSFEDVILPGLAVWSVPGSWIAWTNDDSTDIRVDLVDPTNPTSPVTKMHLPFYPFEMGEAVEDLTVVEGLPLAQAQVEFIERELAKALGFPVHSLAA